MGDNLLNMNQGGAPRWIREPEIHWPHTQIGSTVDTNTDHLAVINLGDEPVYLREIDPSTGKKVGPLVTLDPDPDPKDGKHPAVTLPPGHIVDIICDGVFRLDPTPTTWPEVGLIGGAS